MDNVFEVYILKEWKLQYIGRLSRNQSCPKQQSFSSFTFPAKEAHRLSCLLLQIAELYHPV